MTKAMIFLSFAECIEYSLSFVILLQGSFSIRH